MADYQRWRVSTEDLVDLTPAKARDLVVRCFFDAQRETFAASRREMGVTIDDKNLEHDVLGAVRAAFREIGGDFEAPTVSTLTQAVAVLGRKAAALGTPDDIIGHHMGELSKIFAALPDA